MTTRKWGLEMYQVPERRPQHRPRRGLLGREQCFIILPLFYFISGYYNVDVGAVVMSHLFAKAVLLHTVQAAAVKRR